MATIYLNGVTIETYGVIVTGLGDWLNLPEYTYPTVEIPGTPGTRLVGGISPKVSPGQRTVVCYLNTATTLAERRSKLAALALACRGLIEWSTDEDPNRVCYGVLTSGEGSGIQEEALANPYAILRLRFTVYDPHYYAKIPTLLPLASGERVPLTLGSAACRGLIGINQGESGTGTVEAVLRDRTGAVLQTLTLTGVTLATDDSVLLDCINHEAWRYIAATNTWSEVTGNLTTAGQDFFVFDPLDAPTLELSNGYDGWVAYRKAEQL